MDKIRLELKWAAIFTLAMLLWMGIEKALGWHDELIDKHATYTNFFAPVAILIYVLAIRDKKKSLDGQISFKEGFVSGIIVTLIIGALSPLAQYITHEFITPNYFSNVINYAVESGHSTQAEAEAYFNFKSYLIQSFIGALLMGLVTSAVVAFVLKKK